jgi:hypothetical protein
MKLFVAEEPSGKRHLIVGPTNLAQARALYDKLERLLNVPMDRIDDPTYRPDDQTNVTQAVRICEANAQENDAFWALENKIVRDGGAGWDEQYD